MNRQARRAQKAIERSPDKAKVGPLARYTMTAKQERKQFRAKKSRQK